MTEKPYRLPAVCWLKVTDFIHGWLNYELGGRVKVMKRNVICVQHLDGARAILRMETTDDTMEPGVTDNAMSATRHNCIEAGLQIDEEVTAQFYGIDAATMELYAPIECPRMTMTENGVLRPWTNDTCFGHQQASSLHRLLREAFWDAVTDYDKKYAQQAGTDKYPAIDMIEAFCKETGTPNIHATTIRREWQRRTKRKS